MSEENKDKKQKHFVLLVHGTCMGGWCRYKLKPRLESVGHKVTTTLDLAACGINTKKIEHVHTFADYSKPLLDFLASLHRNEKVVLVGHSFGGIMSIALAMENFSEKISVGIFIAAFIPDIQHKPSFVLQQSYQTQIDIFLNSAKDQRVAKTITMFEPNVNLQKQNHFVLIHGLSIGAWTWYKLKPRLESFGHKVTSLDLAACGINTQKIEHVHTFVDYSKPLLDFLASLHPNEKVILVGHSFGGISVALAMEKFPEKIVVGIFLSAFIPDTQHKPSYVIQQYIERYPVTGWLDTEFSVCGNKTLVLPGSNFSSTKFFQLCSIEDLELMKILIRRGSLFVEDLCEAENLSKEGYGSVPRACIVASDDLAIPLEYQKWMIQNGGGIDMVREINGADHMSMICKPQQLCLTLLEIAHKYA